MEYAADY
jgi:hypothetical protein